MLISFLGNWNGSVIVCGKVWGRCEAVVEAGFQRGMWVMWLLLMMMIMMAACQGASHHGLAIDTSVGGIRAWRYHAKSSPPFIF
jgi:hypothetical protein